MKERWRASLCICPLREECARDGVGGFPPPNPRRIIFARGKGLGDPILVGLRISALGEAGECPTDR